MKLERVWPLVLGPLLEAWRGRAAWLAVLVMALALGGALFAGEVAITDSATVRTVFAAAACRFGAVAVMALLVAASLVREINDRFTAVLLALDLSRHAWYLARLGGFGLLALALAALATAAVAPLAPAPGLAAWGMGLAAELVLVAALTAVCAVTFAQLPATLATVGTVYLVARGITSMQLMAHGPLIDTASLANRVMVWLLDGVALLLPALDRYAPSRWLLHGDGAGAELAAVMASAAIYVVLLAVAGIADLYRREP